MRLRAERLLSRDVERKGTRRDINNKISIDLHYYTVIKQVEIYVTHM
jgi:hypothetical protein